MMENEKAKSKLGFLGLLYVAHKVVIGEDLAEHFSRVKLLLMASDATSNQALGFEKKALAAHVPLIKEFTKKEMGQALGHDEVTFLGITDEKAAGAYLKKSAEGVKK